MAMIQEIFMKSRRTYGLPRIRSTLEIKYGININRKRVRRLMLMLAIQSQIRQKRKRLKKGPDHVIAENILNRNFAAASPNLKWVTDVTQIRYGPKKLWLCVILDLFNNEVIAYRISNHNDLDLTLSTLNAAVKGKDEQIKDLIFHSDRGTPYTSKTFQEKLASLYMQPSMSRVGNCWDNACMESFFSHMKAELYYFDKLRTETEIRAAVDAYMINYNSERIVNRLGCSPVEYRLQHAS